MLAKGSPDARSPVRAERSCHLRGGGRCSAPLPALSPLRCRFLLPQVFNFEKLQEKKTWIAAQEFCRELGAQLLSLGSYEEEHFVANTLNKIFG